MSFFPIQFRLFQVRVLKVDRSLHLSLEKDSLIKFVRASKMIPLWYFQIEVGEYLLCFCSFMLCKTALPIRTSYVISTKQCGEHCCLESQMFS